MQYKINESIIVRYLAIDNEEGLTDLLLTPTNPSGVDQTPIAFTEIGDGLYTATFTPNALGWWLVRVTSASKPKNIYSKSYFVDSVSAVISDSHNLDFHADCDGDHKLLVNDGGGFLLRSQFTEAVDEKFWYLYSIGSGTTNITTSLDLVNTTTSGDCSGIISKLVYEISTGLLTEINIALAFDNPTAVNSSRKWGAISVGETDGVYFQLKNGVLYASTIKGGVNSDHNIDIYKPAAGTFNGYKIKFAGFRAYWYINEVLVYSVYQRGVTPIVNSGNLKIGVGNINTGVTTANSLKVFGITLLTPRARTVINRDAEGNLGKISPDGYMFTEGHGSVKFNELFEDNSINTTNIWTETIVGSAIKTLADNQLSMIVTTGATDSIKYISKQKLKYSSGRDFSEICFGINLGLVTDVNNKREWGIKDGNNSVFFRYTGTTLYGVCTINSSETTQILPFISDGKYHRFNILKKNISSYYFDIDDITVGKLFSGLTSIAPIKYDVPYIANYNSSLATNGLTLKVESVTVVDRTNQTTILMGRDSYGLYREVAVNPDGYLQVVMATSPLNTSVQVVFDQKHSSINSGEWQEVGKYTVPTGYNFNCISFDASSDVANESARAIIKYIMATFNCATNTFSDGLSRTLPQFCSKILLMVTTRIGSGLNDVVTITYTNERGVTGRTCTITIPKNSLVGTNIEGVLQSGDLGIIDITNVTHSATGQAGAFELEGIQGLFYLILNASKSQYQSQSVALGGTIIYENQTIVLMYLSGSAVNNTRRINLMGTLIPK
jgi:hypothetical protein